MTSGKFDLVRKSNGAACDAIHRDLKASALSHRRDHRLHSSHATESQDDHADPHSSSSTISRATFSPWKRCSRAPTSRSCERGRVRRRFAVKSERADAKMFHAVQRVSVEDLRLEIFSKREGPVFCVARGSAVVRDHFEELIEIVGLGEDGLRNADQAGRKTSQENERRHRRAKHLARAAEELLAIHLVHDQIAEDERGSSLTHHAKSRRAPRCGSSRIAGALEHLDDDIAIILVVVDDQYPFRRGRAHAAKHTRNPRGRGQNIMLVMNFEQVPEIAAEG
jgi:hypothetical protein